MPTRTHQQGRAHRSSMRCQCAHAVNASAACTWVANPSACARSIHTCQRAQRSPLRCSSRWATTWRTRSRRCATLVTPPRRSTSRCASRASTSSSPHTRRRHGAPQSACVCACARAALLQHVPAWCSTPTSQRLSWPAASCLRCRWSRTMQAAHGIQRSKESCTQGLKHSCACTGDARERAHQVRAHAQRPQAAARRQGEQDAVDARGARAHREHQGSDLGRVVRANSVHRREARSFTSVDESMPLVCNTSARRMYCWSRLHNQASSAWSWMSRPALHAPGSRCKFTCRRGHLNRYHASRLAGASLEISHVGF
jgi:hypothetical protein